MQLNVMRYRRKWHTCHMLNKAWLPTDRRFDSIESVSRFAKVKGYGRVIVRQNTGKKDISQEVGGGKDSEERCSVGDTGSAV